MREGLIEETRVPRNPVDVLAQQIVAMVAMETMILRLRGMRMPEAPYATANTARLQCNPLPGSRPA